MRSSIRSTSGQQPRANWPLATLAAAVLAALPWQAAQAATKTWNVSTGSWMLNLWSGSFGTPPTTSDDAVISAGTATLDVNQTIVGFTLSGGTRAGTGTLTASSLAFNAGALTGSGATTITGASTFNGANNQTIGSSHTLTLSGNSTWSQGVGSILNLGNILSYGTFTDQGTVLNGVERRLTNGASGYFANVGTYVRQGAGTTVVDRFHNLGTLNVSQGTLRSVGNSGFNGTVSLASGTALEFAGGGAWMGASVSGAGTVRLNGGSLAFNAASSFDSALEMNGGTMDVQVNQTVAALTMNGGTRAGVANLRASSLAFNAGTLNGSGTTTTITGGSTINGGGNQTIGSGHTLTLSGNTTWTAGNGSVLNSGDILSYGTFTDQGIAIGGVARQLTNGTSGYFANVGTYVRQGAGTTVVAKLNNIGTLDVRQGTFKVVGDSGSPGNVLLASGTTLEFAGGNSWVGGAVSGLGTVRVNGGSLAFNSSSSFASALQLSSGTLDVQANQTIAALNMNGGTRTGAANLTASSLAFSVGTLSGSGTTTITGNSTFFGSTTQTIGSGHTLVLNGNNTWSSSGSGSILNLGAITNAASSTFNDVNVTTSGTYLRRLTGVFNNQGTYVRSGGGSTQVSVFNNSGTLNVGSGGIFLVAGSSAFTGQTVLSSGATLTFSDAGSTLSGAVSGDGSVNVEGGGSLAFTSSSSFSSSLFLSEGTLDVQVNKTIAALTINSGARAGAGNLTVSSLVFGSGTLSGASTTSVTGASTFNGTNSQTIGSGHTLILNGDSTWSQANGSMLNSGTITNAANRTFTDGGTTTSAGTRQLSNGSAGVFNNQGTYTRSGQGTTQVSVFNNVGALNVNAGTFKVTGNSAFTGTAEVSSGAVLEFAGGNSTIGGAVSGPGTLRMSGGNLDVQTNQTVGALDINGGTRSGTGTLTASSLTFNAGALTGSGATTITGASTFNGANNQTISSGHTLTLNGNSTRSVGGGGLVNMGTINNQASAIFTDEGNSVNVMTFNSAGWSGTFNNRGTYVRKGLGGTQLGGLNNTGTLDIQSGQVLVDERFANTGAVKISAGAKLRAYNGSQINNGGVFMGNGSVEATLTNNAGTINPGDEGAIGTLSFQGALALGTTSRLHIDLGTGGLSDLLAVSGNFTLGGALELAWDEATALQFGDVFTLATFGSLAPSSFSSVSWNDSNYGFELLYGANDLRVRVINPAIAAVPEPETYALAMSGLLVAWLSTRRRQRPRQCH